MSEVSQEAHYYPFGMAMDGSWLSSSLPKNKYRYNGIEQATNLGLDVYNAFYRTLDPSLARWWQVDPEAESGYGLTPYNSMQNNPMIYSDPEGDWVHIAIGAGIGGLINLGVQAYKGNINSVGDGFAAFGVGFVAGGITAATGGAAAGAGFAQGALIGAGSGVAGDVFLQTGNFVAFGDKYNPTQTLLAGGLGAVGGGLTGHFTKASPSGPGMSSSLDNEVYDVMVETGKPAIRFPDGKIYISVGDRWVLYNKVPKTGTVWDDILPTQGNYSGSVLPRSFELKTTNGKIWVHGNASEHVAEYAKMKAINYTPEAVKLATQQQLRSLQSAVNAATKNGVTYDEILRVGGWELKFGAPRSAGQLPVLFHALPLH